MTRIFFPGCKVKSRYPEASAWLAEQVISRGYADEVACYCFACDMGLEAGGVDAHNMIELVSGKFRKEQ